MKIFTAYYLFFHLLQAVSAQSWPPGKTPIPFNFTDAEKIVGGVLVDPKDRYPYQVALLSGGFQYCAGSLINRSWVLSAAHCAGTNNGRVEIGRWDLTDNDEEYENIAVDYEVTHPDYNAFTLDMDYMLLKLQTPSQYPLVSIDQGNEDLSPGTDVTVMGWGTTSSEGSSSNILREVEVDVVSNAACNSDYGGDVTENMICAARTGKDACQGDSGGPLITRGADNTGDVVVGIVSWGFGCAIVQYPGVYSRVSKGLDWIREYVSFGPTASPTTSSPTVSSAPTAECRPLLINLITDTYAYETSWEIKDPNGIVIQSQSGYDLSDSTEYDYEYCLAPKCEYTFTISDTVGDGICCGYGQGSYSLTYDGELLVTGGEFNSVESTNFGCVGVSDCIDSPTNLGVSNGQVGCAFVGTNVETYCSVTQLNVKSHCPATCSACSDYECADSEMEFTFGGNNIFCSSIPSNFLSQACGQTDIRETCRESCGYCD